MSIVLLRTLTHKSIIGFGNYKDLTVQNLLDTFRARELLTIYYNCRNIDFCQELKDELCIYGIKEINKKEKKEERYIPATKAYISHCLKEMAEKRSEKQNQIYMGFKKKKKNKLKSDLNSQEMKMNMTIYSKKSNQSRNHNNYKK